MIERPQYGRIWRAPELDLFRTDDRDTTMDTYVPPKRRYAIIPGPVPIPGGHEDDFHFVGARELMRLYNVNPAECVVLRPGDERGLGRDAQPALIPLRPRPDGDYTLPEE